MSALSAYSFAAAQRAYGAPATARQAAPAANASAPIAKIGDVVQRATDSVALQARAASDTISERLVAAIVPGRIDFSQDSPTQTRPATNAASLPFYRHPADKNSAATRIAISTAIDVNA